MVSTEIAVTGLHFAESPTTGPDGRLYVSDFYAHQLLAVDPSTFTTEVVAEVPGQPSGMGWLPDGTQLVVSMRDKRVLAVAANGTTSCHADLSGLARGATNDMLVDTAGRAWVGPSDSTSTPSWRPIPRQIRSSVPAQILRRQISSESIRMDRRRWLQPVSVSPTGR